jgi:hypothetical protein
MMNHAPCLKSHFKPRCISHLLLFWGRAGKRVELEQSFCHRFLRPAWPWLDACCALRENESQINQQRSAVINLASFVENGTIHISSLAKKQKY